MDYPNSVPGAGLVGGEFVNEVPVLGQQGSLISAEWGNAVTREILNVVEAADLTPNEQQHDQLLQAILRLGGELSVTGPSTLTGTDNKIVMPSIVSKLKLEKGDVIQIKITGATSYDKFHTVESITNTGEIVVNYEHCGARGNGALKLPDYTGQVSIKRIAKWHSAADGLGQEWVALTSFRSGNVARVNSTGRTIAVSMNQHASGTGIPNRSMSIRVWGVVVANVDSPPDDPRDISCYASVGPGSSYTCEANGLAIGVGSTVQERR